MLVSLLLGYIATKVLKLKVSVNIMGPILKRGISIMEFYAEYVELEML